MPIKCILSEKKVCTKFTKCVALINKKNYNFLYVYIILYFMNSQEYLSDDSSITDDQYDSAVGLVSPEDPAIILRTTVRKDRFSSPENE